MQRMIYFGVIAIIATACNLSANTATDITTPTINITATSEIPTVQPTISAPATSIPQPETSSEEISSDSTADCIPPANWTPYTVVAGDTLFNLAGLSGTTVDNIVSTNCMADANTLAVGQVVYLPATADRIDESTVGTILSVSPTAGTQNGIVLVEPNSRIRVTWNNIPEGSLAAFTGHDYLADGGVYPIGEVIVDRSNSASVDLQIPDTYNGAIVAGARLPGQNHQTVEAQTVLIQTVGFNTGPCAFYPHALGEAGIVYSQPDANNASLGQVGSENSYPISDVFAGTDEKGSTLNFYRIALNGQQGWIRENKGTLRGECAGFE